ncbi:MAG: hypothetical protein A3A44_03625 [Candidatus Sungbacteria bacterium RIFCSPLOWO2_01_FULL_60_25]|uniref:Exonuclease domain-containing protein n=1 Tax=Candidatus Sungbacteria bacterium RIFCSPLOWO2_01_FULL_60_25 TaxID=1802281 RepID=A0A1G2LCS1_9BACT|nr:MAG: hypothetical protein A3A44_03625 [Candidatus Sungbacteria bacterium RIFCSPLOWO2_01_FULL_60_25]
MRQHPWRVNTLMRFTELPTAFILFDTEFTAWEGSQERKWSGPNEHREIVEIGAIRVNGATLTEGEVFDVFVKPVRNPTLPAFFIKLTGITQEMIERDGIDFPSAINRFAEWSGELPLASWGNDPMVLAENCHLAAIPFPFRPERFFDIRTVFGAGGIRADQYYSSTIVRAFGKEPERRGHSGLNDSRTILDGLRLLRDNGEKRP